MSSPKKSPKRTPKSAVSSPVAPVTPVAVLPAAVAAAAVSSPKVVKEPDLVPPRKVVADQGKLEELKVNTVPADAIPKEELDMRLLKRGIVPISRISVKGRTKFIKAYDLRGNTFYIDPEEERDTYISPNDLSMVQIEEAESVPTSLTLSALDCAKLDVCGFAFECNNGVCTIRRDPESLETRNEKFAVVKQPQIRWGKEEGLPVAYPIVKLSELLLNPAAVMMHLEKAALRIEFESIKAYNKELMGIEESFSAFAGMLQLMPKAMKLAEKSVNHSMIRLRNFRNELDVVKDRALYEKLAYNIYLRQRYMNDLLVLTRRMNEQKREFEVLNERLVKQFEEMQAAYNETEMDRVLAVPPQMGAPPV